VRLFLRGKFGEEKIVHGRVDWCRNPETKGQLPFDMIHEDLKIIVEVDGEQILHVAQNLAGCEFHFRFRFRFRGTDWAGQSRAYKDSVFDTFQTKP